MISMQLQDGNLSDTDIDDSAKATWRERQCYSARHETCSTIQMLEMILRYCVTGNRRVHTSARDEPLRW